MINIEHSSTNNNGNQHFQQHFQNHYAATSETNLSDMNQANNRFPPIYDTQSRRHTPLIGNESSQSQIIQTHYDHNGNIKAIEQKEEQHAKKTTQTTTTTTSQQPYLSYNQVDETEPFANSVNYFYYYLF
jgi:hypothetical protein